MPRKPTIEVDGAKHEAVERLGYSHDAGGFIAIVVVDGAERTSFRRPGGKWRFRTASDRIRPLLETQNR